MCCCEKPNVNGTMGYQWGQELPHIRPVNPPVLGEHDTLVYDEPGRCGGLDAHSHHYRVVKWFSSRFLLVRHGGGDERMRLSTTPTLLNLLSTVGSNERYWMLHAIYHAFREGEVNGEATTTKKWLKAAAEGRIKVRKVRGQDRVKVEIKPTERKTE